MILISPKFGVSQINSLRNSVVSTRNVRQRAALSSKSLSPFVSHGSLYWQNSLQVSDLCTGLKLGWTSATFYYDRERVCCVVLGLKIKCCCRKSLWYPSFTCKHDIIVGWRRRSNKSAPENLPSLSFISLAIKLLLLLLSWDRHSKILLLLSVLHFIWRAISVAPSFLSVFHFLSSAQKGDIIVVWGLAQERRGFLLAQVLALWTCRAQQAHLPFLSN